MIEADFAESYKTEEEHALQIACIWNHCSTVSLENYKSKLSEKIKTDSAIRSLGDQITIYLCRRAVCKTLSRTLKAIALTSTNIRPF